MDDAVIEAIGGVVGSSISLAATYPLVQVSIWQSLEHKSDSKQHLELRQLEDRYKHLPTPIRELMTYSKLGGWNSLFAGLKPCLAATAISSGIYFYLYSAIRQAVVAHNAVVKSGGPVGTAASPTRSTDIGVLGSIIVASLAGCGNVLVTNPVWVVATQMQANQKRSDPRKRRQSATSIARQLLVDNGIAGLWKGILPALVMVINPTLQYILYEWLTARLLDMRRQAVAPHKRRFVQLAMKDVFLLTALAKLGSTLVTYPMLLIKSRMQAINKSTDQAMQYTGLWDAVSRIQQNEGLQGFFKGMKVKMVQTVLAAALLMSIKEQVFKSTRSLLKGHAAAHALVAVGK